MAKKTGGGLIRNAARAGASAAGSALRTGASYVRRVGRLLSAAFRRGVSRTGGRAGGGRGGRSAAGRAGGRGGRGGGGGGGGGGH
jgi:hypothetical protein